MIGNAKTALQKIAVDTAGAGASTATGFAETLKAGFPQNVPYCCLRSTGCRYWSKYKTSS